MESDDPSESELTELPEVSYAGIKTFLQAEESLPGDLTDEAEIGVIGVPYDGGVDGVAGARHGPEALRKASQKFAYFSEYKGRMVNIDTNREVNYQELDIRDCNDVPIVPNDIKRTRDQIAAYVREASNHVFPVVLGGDHYVTYPSFTGFANSVEGDVGLIQLDTHTDTVDSSKLWGKHWHASPMARIAESEYGGFENHAMVGVSGYEKPEFFDLIDDQGLLLRSAQDIRKRGIEPCIAEAIEHASDGVDHVYLTVDIDVAGSAYAPGIGEPGGITSNDLLGAMDLLGDCEAIGAMDLMEVAPSKDPTGSTQILGVKSIIRFLESKFF